MRIITGALKGRILPFNARRAGQLRLTSSLLKEAVFSMLGPDLEGLSFLDLCAGTGQMGLEAHSRGARSALNEPDKRRYTLLQGVQREWGLEGLELYHMKGQVLIPWLEERGRRFDLVYADPPYEALLSDRPLCLGLLEGLGAGGLLSERGWCFVQHQRKLELPAEAGRLRRHRSRDYGQTTLSLYSPLPLPGA
ncbi:MAG: RsmD family RNA methyltransferase [Candidatus Handelsmanbacteria bacterium]|nr:RsmD family RNA methyltransferase [Candidatus Handelsmanbacteria bacterium]